MIPSLTLENAPFLDAIDELRLACVAHDPHRLQGKPYGFSFIVKLTVHHESGASPAADPFASVPPSIEYQFPTVSIHAVNKGLADVLEIERMGENELDVGIEAGI